MSQRKLLYVLVAMALAVFAGHYTGMEKEIFGVSYYQIYALLGQLFLSALMLVVVPLVVSSIISGVGKMGSESSFERLGLKTFAVFLGTTLMAILIGWGVALWLQPGEMQMGGEAAGSAAQALAAKAGEGGFSKLEKILFRLIPSNIFATAAEGQMLGLIVFSLLFGYFITKIPKETGGILLGFWQGVFQVMMKMTEFFMKFLPIGVFGLVAKVVASTGIESIKHIGSFFFTVIFGLLIYMFVALGLLLFFWGRVKPFSHLKAMMPALFTAFSTSSSAASLPAVMECVETKSGVSNRIASFALPLGSSINLAGSSLQVVVSVFFIAQVYGAHLGLATEITVILLAWLLSLGVAGIPSASLVSIVIILSTIGLPGEGIGLIMAVERILDMCRTTVNAYSNSCSAVLIARSEGETLPIER